LFKKLEAFGGDLLRGEGPASFFIAEAEVFFGGGEKRLPAEGRV